MLKIEIKEADAADIIKELEGMFLQRPTRILLRMIRRKLHDREAINKLRAEKEGKKNV